MIQNRHAEAVSVLLPAARLVGVRSGGTRHSHGIAGMSQKRAGQTVEVVCSLLLSLRRSALWAVVDEHMAYAELLQQLLQHDPSLLLKCCNSAHALEIGLSPAQTRELADVDARRFMQDMAPLRATLRSQWASFLLPPPSNTHRTPLRVAYLSGTGFQSFTTTAHFVIGILEAHDNMVVDARCYAFLPDDGCVYMCVCVCVCIFMYILTYIGVYIQLVADARCYAFLPDDGCVYMYVCVCVCSYMYRLTYIHVCVRIQLVADARCYAFLSDDGCVYMYVCLCVYIYIY